MVNDNCLYYLLQDRKYIVMWGLIPVYLVALWYNKWFVDFTTSKVPTVDFFGDFPKK